MGFQEAQGVAAEAAFEDVDAPQLLAFFQYVGDATKVVVPAVVRLRPLHARPLQQVVGHQVALLVGGCAVHVPAPPAEAQYDDARDGLALVLGQQQRGSPVLVTGSIETHHVFIVTFVVDEERVALAGRLVDVVERVEVGLPAAFSYRHSFAGGQAHIVAPFLLHARQDILFVGPQVEHPFVAHVRGVGIGTKVLRAKGGQPCLVTVWDARLDLEHERASFARLDLHEVEQHAQCGRRGIVDDGAAWRVEIDATQYGCAGNQYQHNRA